MRDAANFGPGARWARAILSTLLCAGLAAPVLASAGCSDDPGMNASSDSSGSGGSSGSSTSRSATTTSTGTSSSSGSSSAATSSSSGGGNATVKVQILAINDFHGNLEPPAGGGGQITLPDMMMTKVNAGGVSYLATHIANLRAQNPNTVV